MPVAVLVVELTLVALVLQLAVTRLDRGTAVLALGLAHLVAADTLTSRATAPDREADEQARAESRASSTTVVLLFGCTVAAAVTAPGSPADLVTAVLLVSLALALGARELILQRLRVRQVGALSHLARHDPLTGLGNRRAVQAELVRARTGDVSVLVLDLDGFKGVDDQLGHLSGDTLLVEVASALRAVAPGLVAAFRLGGDEFALVGAVATARMVDLARDVSEAVAAAAARVPGWTGCGSPRASASPVPARGPVRSPS